MPTPLVRHVRHDGGPLCGRAGHWPQYASQPAYANCRRCLRVLRATTPKAAPRASIGRDAIDAMLDAIG